MLKAYKSGMVVAMLVVLLALAAIACTTPAETTIKQVEVEKIVTQQVIQTVEVPKVEVVREEVVRTVEVPVETVVTKEVVREIPMQQLAPLIVGNLNTFTGSLSEFGHPPPQLHRACRRPRKPRRRGPGRFDWSSSAATLL